MAAITSLILADGLATPVNRTFVPAQPQVGNSPAVWYEKTATTPAGYLKITSLVTRNGNGVYKVRFTVALPVLAIVPAGCCVDANTPAVSYTEIFNGEFSMPQGTTVAQRKDLRAFSRNLLNHAMAISAIEDLEIAW